MQSYSRQRRLQLGLDLLEGRIYERSLGFYPREKTPRLPLRKKEAACSKLKKSPTDHQQQKYRELRAKAKTRIRESREIYFSSLDSDLARQPKRFWSFFKLKNKTRTFPETMSSGDDNQQGPQASTPQQIAELFNSYFVSVFTAPSEIRTLSAHFTSSHPTLNELEIPVEMVLTSLKQLDINKATGSDGIPVRLLKETADQIAPSLTMLLDKSLRLGIFPGDWKLENIVPFSRKEREALWRITALFPFSLSPPKFSSPTSSFANSMAF